MDGNKCIRGNRAGLLDHEQSRVVVTVTVTTLERMVREGWGRR